MGRTTHLAFGRGKLTLIQSFQNSNYTKKWESAQLIETYLRLMGSDTWVVNFCQCYTRGSVGLFIISAHSQYIIVSLLAFKVPDKSYR